jgi:hypothetical protein
MEIDRENLTLPSGAVERIPVRVHVQAEALDGAGSEIVFRVRASDDDRLSAETDSRFLGPMPGR